MHKWLDKPFIYEINTAVWLNTLSQTYNKPITLSNVPEQTLDELAALNVDAVWLMGAWHRSKAGRASALNYIHEYRHALPDVEKSDVIGSAYAVGAYKTDRRLGGVPGLAKFRKQLQQRNLKLILDFVPNHVATDHAWVSQHPDYFMRGTLRDLKTHSDDFFKARDERGRTLVVSHGRDPNYPGWIDTAQLDAFSHGYRKAALNTLLDVADQCDGVRCDMAMLMNNDIFANTWNGRVGPPPKTEFWEEIIPKVKALYPDFIFIAEVYWGKERTLQQEGFDFTYDKTLYDHIINGKVDNIRHHLRVETDFQKKTVNFIENHDEARSADVLGVDKSRPAATLICTLPGAVLLHDGQFTGRKVKLPMQIKRQPDERSNRGLEAFYRRLLSETRAPIYQTGKWRLFDVQPAWEENGTHKNLLAYGWDKGEEYRLIIVNLTPEWSQGKVNLKAWNGFSEHDWRLTDSLHDAFYYRRGDQMIGDGLYIELAPYDAHIFRFERIVVSPSNVV